MARGIAGNNALTPWCYHEEQKNSTEMKKPITLAELVKQQSAKKGKSAEAEEKSSVSEDELQSTPQFASEKKPSEEKNIVKEFKGENCTEWEPDTGKMILNVAFLAHDLIQVIGKKNNESGGEPNEVNGAPFSRIKTEREIQHATAQTSNQSTTIMC